MPRETWSVEIQADIARALAQIQSLRSQISGLGATKAMTITPTFSNAGVAKGVQQMGQSLNTGRRQATGFLDGIQEDFGNFGRIFASRLAFTFATAVQRFIIGSLLLIPAAFAGAIVAGAKFENAIRRTATVAVGGFGDIEGAMDQLGTTARQVGADTTFTATEVATAMYELVSVGLSVRETQDAITASANFAVAVQTDLATAVDITTQIMKSFNMNASELADVGDKLVFAINNTTLNMSNLQAALRFAAPAAGALGISFDDMLTVVAKFVDVTKQGGIAGRAFRFMVAALADPTDEAAGAIKKLGISLEEVDPQMNSLEDIMKRFADTTMTGGEAFEIFGKRAGGPVAGAINSIRLGLAAGVDEMANFKRGLLEAASNDAALKQAQEFMKTLASEWKLFVSKIVELGLQVFDVIGPAVIAATHGVNALLKGLIAVGPYLREFLRVSLAIVAVSFAQAIIGWSGAIRAFIANTRAASATLTTFQALQFTQAKAMVPAVKAIRDGGGAFASMSLILARLMPYMKAFIGKAGIVGLIAGMVLWARHSALLNGLMQGLVYLVKSIGEAIATTVFGFESLNKALTWVNELIQDTINFGLDGIFYVIAKAIGTAAQGLADLAATIPFQQGTAAALQAIADRANKSAEGIVAMNIAQADAKAAAEKHEKAANSLLETLKLTVVTLEDFKNLDAAVVESYNNQIAAGADQETALNRLQKAFTELFLNAEKVGGEYSKELLPLMERAIIAFGLGATAVETYAEKMERLQAAHASVFGTNSGEVSDALDEIFDAMELVADTTMKLTDTQLLALREQLKKLREDAVAAGIDLGATGLGARLDEAGEVANKLHGKIQLISKDTADFSKELKKLPDAITGLETTLPTFEGIRNGIKAVGDRWEEAQRLFSRGLVPPGAFDEVRDDLTEMAKKILEARDYSFETKLEFTEMAARIGIARLEGESFEGFIKRLAEEAKVTKGVWDDFFTGMREGAGKAFADALIQGKNFTTALTTMFRGIVVSFSSTISQGFSNAFSESFASAATAGDGFVSSLTSSIGDGLGGIKDLFTGESGKGFFGDLLSGAIGGLISGGISVAMNLAMKGLGALAGKLKDIFGGTNATKELKKLGLAVSEELTKKIEEANDALGDYGAAIRQNLGDIIREEGIENVQALTKFLGMMNDTLSDLDRGTISSGQAMESMGDAMTEILASAVSLNSTEGFLGVVNTLVDVLARTNAVGASMVSAADATKLLNDQFPALVEASKNFGAAGMEGFRAIIEGARAAGLEVESINNYVTEHATSLVNNIRSLVERTLNEEGEYIQLTADQIMFAASALGTAFAELRASGMPIPEIIAAMGESLQIIIERAKELGIKLPPSFRLFAGLGALFENEFVKPQLEGLSAITGAFESLMALGIRPTQADFETLTGQAQTAFDTMIEQGASSNKALLAIAPSLALIRDLAADYGLEIDDNTQKLIDQAEESGVLAERQMSTTDIMKTGFELVGEAINRLIETMGGVPIELDKWGDSAEKNADRTGTAAKTAGKTIADEMTTGAKVAKDVLNDVGNVSNTVFSNMSESVNKTVKNAMNQFNDLENELIGESVFPDIAIGAKSSFKAVEDSGVQAADMVRDRFGVFKPSITPGGTAQNFLSTFLKSMPKIVPVGSIGPSGGGGTDSGGRDSFNSGVLFILKRIAEGVEGGSNISVSIDGNEVSRHVQKRMINNSLNGRLIFDEGSIGQLQG